MFSQPRSSRPDPMNLAYFDALGQLESPREFPEPSFSDGVPVLAVFRRLLRIRRNGELAVGDIELDIFL